MQGTHSRLSTADQATSTTTSPTIKLDALNSLDQSTHTDGMTPFHEAARVGGNPRILEYLIKVLKGRNELLQKPKN